MMRAFAMPALLKEGMALPRPTRRGENTTGQKKTTGRKQPLYENKWYKLCSEKSGHFFMQHYS